MAVLGLRWLTAFAIAAAAVRTAGIILPAQRPLPLGESFSPCTLDPSVFPPPRPPVFLPERPSLVNPGLLIDEL